MGMIKTRVLRNDFAGFDAAAELLNRGEVIALPTETVYGIAARADMPDSIERIFALKGRHPDKPMPICISSEKMAGLVASVSEPAKRLMQAFWPGPLTIILPRQYEFELPPQCYGEDGTIGLRCPDTPWARALRERHFNIPLALTSANRSGDPASNSAQEVLGVFAGDLPLIIDGGEGGGTPSTIVRVTGERPEILREGHVSLSEIEAAIGMSISA